jgi:hypothetical protein
MASLAIDRMANGAGVSEHNRYLNAQQALQHGLVGGG